MNLIFSQIGDGLIMLFGSVFTFIFIFSLSYKLIKKNVDD